VAPRLEEIERFASSSVVETNRARQGDEADQDVVVPVRRKPEVENRGMCRLSGSMRLEDLVP
jgi:hypothetical protein